MSDLLERLLAAGSPALGASIDVGPDLAALGLEGLLKRRNGFYAFESALHVRPLGAAEAGELTISAWNAPDLWRDAYGDLADGHVFFAEDVFGGQFSVSDDGVWSWDPETGEAESMGRTVEDWAAALLADYEVLTGQPLAREWQRAHGALKPGERLLPVTPFVLGGEFAVENLRAAEAVGAMRMRGRFASQLRDLPDGAQVSITYVDAPG